MKTAYKDGIILDGTKEMTARRGETVIVENGRITDILPSGGLLPSDCEIVNLNDAGPDQPACTLKLRRKALL